MEVRRHGKFIARKAPLKVALPRGKTLHFLLEALVFAVVEHVSLFRELVPDALERAVVRRIPLKEELGAFNPHGLARINRQPENARILRSLLRSRIPLEGKFRGIVAERPQAVPHAGSHPGPVAAFHGDAVKPERLELRPDILLKFALKPRKPVAEVRRPG